MASIALVHAPKQPGHGDATLVTTQLPVPPAMTSTGFTAKYRKPKAKRKRKGWGPFQSVLKERSVDFNLTLDIQNLKQEIQQLTTSRDLFQSRSLQLRHAPTGSLLQLTREFVRQMRLGFPVQIHEYGRRHVITTGQQRDFLECVVDAEIDFGGGNCGVWFMVEQFRRYSQLLRFISMDMDTFEIVPLDDDAVMIRASGSWCFQVLRETVVGLFPHVVGNEWLLSKLVGAVLVAPTSLCFHFNRHDRISTYAPDADFVAAFSSLLTDYRDVVELLGQARIGEHSVFGVSDSGHVEDIDVYATEPGIGHATHESTVQHTEQSKNHHQEPNQSITPDLDFYGLVVDRYVEVFTQRWRSHAHYDNNAAGDAETQWQFLHEYVSPNVSCGSSRGYAAICGVWQELSSCFELLDVRAETPPRVYHQEPSVVSVHIQLAYDLRIDLYTIQRVFPHVLVYPSLADALLGADITCSSVLEMQWDSTESDHDGGMSSIRERLDWETALALLLPNASDLYFVLRHALLSPEGYSVDGLASWVVLDLCRHECQECHVLPFWHATCV